MKTINRTFGNFGICGNLLLNENFFQISAPTSWDQKTFAGMTSAGFYTTSGGWEGLFLGFHKVCMALVPDYFPVIALIHKNLFAFGSYVLQIIK